MKHLFFTILIVFSLSFSQKILAWGMTGHRVVGEVASKHLTKKAQQRIKGILGNQTLAEVSNFLDDIKSDNQEKYDTLRPYHYVSIPDGMKYEETNINPKGDVVVGIKFVVRELKKGNLDPETEAFYLKILVHLVGDIHQPLHVGRADDIGGNAIHVSWFGKKSNLHAIWDSEMLEGKLYSYTELTALIDHSTQVEIVQLQTATIDDWIAECMELRPGIYDYKEGKYWEYKYLYNHWDTIQNQLLKGGIRLAGILNDIYG